MNEGKKDTKGKPIFGAIPPHAELEIAKGLTFGAEKYDRENWRLVKDGAILYMDAAMRHINAYRRGERVAEDSGLHHLAHAVCNLMFLIENDFTPKAVAGNCRPNKDCSFEMLRDWGTHT